MSNTEAQQLATQLVAHLSQIEATVAMAVPYGCKVAVRRGASKPLGHLVIYVGKKGPRLVTSELQQPTAEELAEIEQAWVALTDETRSPSHTASPAIDSSSDVTELWVDGACLSHDDGLQFGWAFAIRRNSAVIHTGQGHVMPDHAVPHRNVGSELEATLQGLRWCVQHGIDEVVVLHDYTGIAHWITGTWRAKQPFTHAYVETVQGLPLRIRFQKVLAHSGIPTNELVDRLATESAQQSRLYRFPTDAQDISEAH